jgi:hypothetical protein
MPCTEKIFLRKNKDNEATKTTTGLKYTGG